MSLVVLTAHIISKYMLLFIIIFNNHSKRFLILSYLFSFSDFILKEKSRIRFRQNLRSNLITCFNFPSK